MARKIKRPQTLIGIGTVICGLFYFLAEVFSGGIPMIYPFSFWQWVSLVGIAIGTGLIIYGLLKDDTPSELVKYNFSKLYRIIPILRKMDRHLWELAEKQRIVDIDFERLKKTGAKINELMGVSTRSISGFNQSIEEIIKNTKHIIKEQHKEVSEVIGQQEEVLKIVRGTTRLLDLEGYGLEREKQSDRKYKKHRKRITKYYDDNKELVDMELQSLISLHVDMSEYFANGWLVLRRVDIITKKMKVQFGDIFPASTQANLGDLKKDSDIRLNEIRVSISDYIRGLVGR